MTCPFVLKDQIRAHLEVNEGEMVTVLYLTSIVLYAVCRYTCTGFLGVKTTRETNAWTCKSYESVAVSIPFDSIS